jgi:hypothetical protein
MAQASNWNPLRNLGKNESETRRLQDKYIDEVLRHQATKKHSSAHKTRQCIQLQIEGLSAGLHIPCCLDAMVACRYQAACKRVFVQMHNNVCFAAKG